VLVQQQQFAYHQSVDAEPDLARIASTVGDPRRIQMLALLMEGRALTAKELALGAGIEPATATSHLKRLLDDGLVESASQGRHKYFRFASEQVAQLVESLMRVAPRRKAISTPKSEEAIRSARFCYDHLAGSLGTGLLALMLRKGWLQNDGADAKQLELTAKGEKSLAGLGRRDLSDRVGYRIDLRMQIGLEQPLRQREQFRQRAGELGLVLLQHFAVARMRGLQEQHSRSLLRIKPREEVGVQATQRMPHQHIRWLQARIAQHLA